MDKLKSLTSSHIEAPFDIQEGEVELAKKRFEDYNLSISGDVSISVSDQADFDSKNGNENYESSTEIVLSAQCENDGWEEGYDY